MTIQWFPGHMTKARRQIEENLKKIDVVIELLDARAPQASRNPMIDDILRHKPRLVVMNKSDLADPIRTEQWVRFFRAQGLEALPIDALTGTRVQDIVPRLKQLLQAKRQARLDKGLQPRAIRALIVGIPNVGKSTLINRLANKHIAATGDRPGVTKGQQWIRIAGQLELLDTPGILWPKFDDPLVGQRLAILGSIKEEILPVEDVGFHALDFLLAYYPHAVEERYPLQVAAEDVDANQCNDEDDSGQAAHSPTLRMMEDIGRKRGCLLPGGRLDYAKTALLILRDLRSGKLGGITLEWPVEEGSGDGDESGIPVAGDQLEQREADAPDA